MELFRSDKHYIFVKDEASLWWSRSSGAFSVKSAWDLSEIDDIECLGITDGIIGQVDHTTVYEPRLIIIRESAPIGQLYFHHTIYKIKSICFLNLGTANPEIELMPCTKHGSFDVSGGASKSTTRKMGARLFENSAFLNKTFGAVKNASNTIKTTTQQAATQVKQTVNKKRDPKLAERFDKRLTDELHKIFDDSDSFYYSRTLDITSSLQRQYENEKELEKEEQNGRPITDVQRWWKHVDDRFFWNKHMLKDIIALGNPDCDPWILPIIQGYVQLTVAAVDPGDALNTESLLAAGPGGSCDEVFTIGLISRRSRYQAGTRYNRRGIEPSGKVANYVETEQIVSIICSDSIHRASFLQVRGSVPIYWSQPEYKFRPPPRLDKDEDETQIAFNKHFEEELSRYKNVCIVNLVEQQGREKIIWDAYSDHVLNYDSPNVIYATFDFHEYCRGMHYENVSILINALADVINDMKFCWRDDRGLICSQNGVFRVNCIDCLDRTNVVQTAIAKWVLELQLCRLGLGAPGSGLPPSLRHAFLTMWADNGDMISRQYAGTKALKGDYTRTGERKFTGIMKDGVASANRFIICHFRDAMTQYAIDIALGQEVDVATVEEHDSLWRAVRTASLMVYENVDVEGGARLELMPTYFGHTLTSEFATVEIVYGLIRYYLSTFKDALRQVAIDVMTGESKCIPEHLIQQGSAGTDSHGGHTVKVLSLYGIEFEPDTQAMAQHVKSLIDDCKKMLVPASEPVLGSWGLIDADPNTGDPLETEMDSVVLLTGEAYYVADYDDAADRFVSVGHVQLSDVNSLEFGTVEVPSTQGLFGVGRKPSVDPVCCIRINYSVSGEAGYFHQFRSTGLRFFNNMAVVIHTKDEMAESLHSICESIMVARDVAKLSPIPFHDGVKLERRKSKINPQQGGAGRGTRGPLYLDLSKLPTITRNVSETQLVADIKSVDDLPPVTCLDSLLDTQPYTPQESTSKKILFDDPPPVTCLDSLLNTQPYTPQESTSKKTLFSKVTQFSRHTVLVAEQKEKLILNSGVKSWSNSKTKFKFKKGDTGSKALTNMSEQFSKLNKLSHTLNAKARPTLQLRLDQGATKTKKIFTLGQNRTNDSMRASKKKGSLSDGMSSDYSSDDENRTNIFEPTLDNFENIQHYIGKGTEPKIETDVDCDLIENPLYSSKIEPSNDDNMFLSSAGIVMGYETTQNYQPSNKTPMTSQKKNPFDLETPSTCTKTPEIQIEFDKQPSNSLKMNQKLSQSSCEMNYSDNNPGSDAVSFHVRSNSQHDIAMNIAQSHSESALKQLMNIASPVSSSTRDIVLSPFSKIAKGMQNLGANLDPRKIKTSGAVKHISEQQYEDHRKLQEKWRNCNTKLIAL